MRGLHRTLSGTGWHAKSKNGDTGLSAISKFALWLGQTLGILAATASMASGHGFDMATVAFVAAVCVIWWVFEPVPIPVTSLLPLAVLVL